MEEKSDTDTMNGRRQMWDSRKSPAENRLSVRLFHGPTYVAWVRRAVYVKVEACANSRVWI